MSKIKIKILCDLTDYKGIEEKLINAGFEVSVDARFALVNVINNDIIIKTTEGKIIVDVNKIVSIESFNHEIIVKTTDAVYKSRMTLSEFNYLLSNINFVKLNQSTIVSKQFIRKIKVSLGQRFTIIMSNNDVHVVTRSYYHTFKDSLGI